MDPQPPLSDDLYKQLNETGIHGDRMLNLAAEMARRRKEALRIYTPLPTQAPFFQSGATIRVIRGGNRSGKSRAGYCETARAATGQDPWGKFPTDRPILIYILTYDADVIGRVAYQMLFGRKNDRFKRIKDLATGEWRVWRPWEPSDAKRESEATNAGPFIPKRMIDEKSWSFDNKRNREFKSVRLKGIGAMDGTEIRAYSSRANPAMGDPVDLVFIDEDLFDDSWLSEMEARLSDNNGKLIWSAWPKGTNNALIELSDRAAKCEGQAKPDVEEFIFTFSGNPFIPEDAKRKRINSWSPDERRARDYGEFLTNNILMYPSYSIHTHGVPCDRPGRLEQVLGL